MDDAPGGNEAIRGFLLALHDCCVTRGADVGVPRSVVTELANRAAEKLRIQHLRVEPEMNENVFHKSVSSIRPT